MRHHPRILTRTVECIDGYHSAVDCDGSARLAPTENAIADSQLTCSSVALRVAGVKRTRSIVAAAGRSTRFPIAAAVNDGHMAHGMTHISQRGHKRDDRGRHNRAEHDRRYDVAHGKKSRARLRVAVSSEATLTTVGMLQIRHRFDSQHRY